MNVAACGLVPISRNQSQLSSITLFASRSNIINLFFQGIETPVTGLLDRREFS